MTGEQWGVLVRRWATRRGMDLGAVSLAMGRSTPQLTQVLNGQRGREADPRLSVMRRVAEAMDCDLRVTFVARKPR